jgi:hypothetical protein
VGVFHVISDLSSLIELDCSLLEIRKILTKLINSKNTAVHESLPSIVKIVT